VNEDGDSGSGVREQQAEPTPVIYDEFKNQCNSEYVISDKDSESAISSDGEFIDAGKINVFDEDDSHIDKIEKLKSSKQFMRDSIYTGPDTFQQNNAFT
jgi:hypothetical protein